MTAPLQHAASQGDDLPQGYKRTEVGVIPVDWAVNFIEDLLKISTGARNTQDRVDDGAYPFFVRSQNVESINTYFYDEEAVLTAGDGVGTGKVFHYINGKYDAHQRVYRIFGFSEAINGKFFFKIFSNKFYDRIMQMTAKSSVDSVRRDMIARMLIPVPKIKEQELIVAALSDVDGLIATLTALIAKKRAVKHATMQQLLTGKTRLAGFTGAWEVRRLGDVCNQFKTGKLDANAMKIDGEYRFYTCARDYYFIDYYAFDAEALLVSGNGANVGYIHYYKGKFNAYQRTYVLTEFSANIQFLKLYMERNLQERIRVEVNAGNTPYITMDTLTEMQVFLPQTIEEQTAIAAILTDMDTDITTLETRLAKTKALKTGMCQELLTGKTRLL
jgi:type I restriction enzyme S subunit